ncbi:MAG: valine--tRNA ligase [Candidatus Eisenbacteria bacterium]|nr:valine--tRNA ligase [Candidatus Eisenbacteria bacterium]
MPIRELERTFDPALVEGRIYKAWKDSGQFHARPTPARKPFTIMIPPPNVTGILHMGHVLDNTIQDVVIRFRRMQGWEALWQPGTDHAGIATQNVVEKKLRDEGTSRKELGREEFVARVWKWREEYGGVIIRQLQRLGASCDWERERFTMDEGLSSAVEEAFLHLYAKGLIYRGHYIVNWCPRCQTAISDEEVEHVDVEGRLHFVTYPFEIGGTEGITVATTRPETILGDVAVAVNPADERYQALIGKSVHVPFIDRPIPIIADDYVEMEFGAGALKVTPAHDINDFELGKRHHLEPIVVIDETGTMNAAAGPFAGQDRFVARKGVVHRLKEMGLLARVENHAMSLGHCHRCNTVIEPLLSRQWFVKMGPLAEPAIRALKSGRLQFAPEHWNKVYLNWMTNIRDWCISRQLWWGHRIPVWYCDQDATPHAGRGAPTACTICGGAAFTQDPDVLDTWFSSWLWPFSTLGWPERTKDLDYFYPTQYLTTGPDIIFFWVARMVMAGIEFMDREPFPVVYLHGIVRDEQGRKMSKSLGNSPDPLDLIDRYGADALRYTMILLTPSGQDVLFSEKKCEVGRNFANKIWNASRLALSHMEGFDPAATDWKTLPLQDVDRWILSRLDETVESVTGSLDTFRYNEAARDLYEFAWGDFCDWYLEFAKQLFYAEPGPERTAAQAVTHEVLATLLHLLHPFQPFITEELWSVLPGGSSDGASLLIRRPWPVSIPERRDDAASAGVAHLKEIITSIRNLRIEMNVSPGKNVDVVLKARPNESGILSRLSGYVRSLAKVGDLVIGPEVARPEVAAAAVVGETEVFLSLTGAIDLTAESARLNREIDKIEKLAQSVEKKLANEDFRAKAPAEVVEAEGERLKLLRDTRARLADNLAIISGGAK